MNPEEQTVTWLISLGVLNSPKKNICDPQDFLKCSLKDGVVLCKLMSRLLPGSVEKVSGQIGVTCTLSDVCLDALYYRSILVCARETP